LSWRMWTTASVMLEVSSCQPQRRSRG
jgi:hypothetical protein